ncbi:hypothetical protein [Helicobacter pylori]|uniref:hypothetical protein n=1 Tax=Helicobacter pylori TaxID=210 RepID=UPI002159FA4A|nr:hypothetical protein [Helicobacter pylori]
MGNLASGHFKSTNNIQEQHNDRTLSPSYLIPQEFRGQNEVNRSSTQAIELKERIIENAKETYLIAFKQKLKSKSYQWSLVVNIKTNTTMSDLEKLAEHFEIKYRFQCYQIAIHRDEGFIDENNQPYINHHAHMEFITLNKENGKNMWRQINQVKLRQIQTEIAQILDMERGTDKRVSGTERIEPRKYAQMKNKERKKLEAKEQELNTLENKLQDKDKTINKLQERPTTEQYSQLEQANSEQAQTIQEKDKEIATALDTANEPFQSTKETLQEAVERSNIVIEQFFLLKNIHNNPTDENAEKKAEKHKHYEVFTKLWNAIKLLYNIIEKLFGDKNAKKDHQDILNTISELQERPTKQQLETLKQEKNKEIATLKQEKDNLTNQLQKQATETKKAQERIKTLENSKKWLENDLEALESNIKCRARMNQEKNKEINTLKDKLQEQEKTINELTKKLQDLKDNYNQERERMKAENKRLKEQGLEKNYTQKDYEDLKKVHHQEVEELKKQIQEYKTQETYTPTKRM